MWTERRSALGVLVLTLAAFLPSMQGSFVWDDALLIANNAAMRERSGFVQIATSDLWGQATGASTQLYHPLPMLSIWAQTQLFGVRVVPLRLFNLALHLMVVGCFVQLLRRLRMPAGLAWLGGLIVAVHPSVCEPVMWITGRHDTLGVLLLMAALLSWRETVLRALGCGVCLALAFLSKEPYVVGPVLLALWVAALHAASGVRVSGRVVGLLLLAGLPLMAAMSLRRALGISAGSAQLHAGLFVHVQSFASVVWHYGSQLVRFDNGLTIAPYQPLTAAGVVGVWLVLLAVSAGLCVLAWRDRQLGVAALLGWSWFLMALSPHVISVPSIGLYGNRYAYCALLGLTMCGVGLIARMKLPSARAVQLAAAGAVVIGVGCTFKLALEASTWSDNRSLYLADVVRAPDNGYALYHLGTAVLTDEGCSAALPLFVRATQLAPRYERAFHNAAGCLINLGRAADAQPFALHAVELSPYDARSRHNLALAELARGHAQAAREQLQLALRLDPHYAPAERSLRMLDARSLGAH